jgi:FkbM family methyltransferase
MRLNPHVSVSPRLREGIRRIAKPLHLEEPLRRVYERLNRTAALDRIANEHTRLLLAFGLREDSNCIDIGAHSGEVLREIVRCAPKGRHIAYEPLPEFAARLAAEFPAVDVRQAALSNEVGEVDFHVVVDDPMQSGIKARPDAQLKRVVRVPLDTLDHGLPEGFVPDLIKIDVEGAEQQVLQGAIGTITRHQPVVVFEHGAGLEDQYGTSSGTVYDLLVHEAGLRIFDINGVGPYSRAQFESLYYAPIWNFVAHR